MITEIECARLKIEQTLIERQAVCDQIDAVMCETGTDIMAYIYDRDGDCFTILIEFGAEVEHFNADWLEQALWPRCASATLH